MGASRERDLFKEVAATLVVALMVASATEAFVRRQGTTFVDDTGKVLRVGGTNNYYLHYKPEEMVTNLFSNASASGFNVVRVWGFLDVGYSDGSNSVDGIKEGVYFQYWHERKPAFNDGPNGLQRLDRVVARAVAYNVKLIIVLTNNWKDFGGMDQYVRWRGGSYHDQFYTDEKIKGWYKAWVDHLLNRRNIYTNRLYKDEPTIFAWELANEPRCQGSGTYGTSGACHYGSGAAMLTRWVTEMSSYVKSIDPNHMVAVGDEGFGCFDGASVNWDWTLDCYAGVDTIAFGRVDSIDFMTSHLYPSHWSKSVQWADGWIESHIEWAHQNVGKPILMEEFGISWDQLSIYSQWTTRMDQLAYNGWNFWMLVTDNYPNYDGFAIYGGSDVCRLLSQKARQL